MATLPRRDRQPTKPRPAKPSAISAHVEGSGIVNEPEPFQTMCVKFREIDSTGPPV
jgi:hypothetical protein